jgi:hypothetical protein
MQPQFACILIHWLIMHKLIRISQVTFNLFEQIVTK